MNSSKLWDEEAIRYFYNNQDKYNFLNYECIEMALKELLATPRSDNKNDIFFDILDDEKCVGEFWTNETRDNREIEISLRIFDEYSGNGYASKAIEYYINNGLDVKLHNFIVAIVKDSNFNKNILNRIFSNYNFQEQKCENETLWCYIQVPFDNGYFTPNENLN